jgi:hypothetical protein
MAAKALDTSTSAGTGPKGPRGKRGPIGATGSVGPAGPAGPAAFDGGELVRLEAQIAEILKELQIQLTRIAQMQAQLDRLASGQAAESRNRRTTDQPKH